MKKIFTFIGTYIFFNTISVFAAGGPDAYGYTWKDSNDPGGPVYTWFDISTVGTPITGLADDNAALSLISIGFNFHYYWSDYNKIKVGSNGWLSFDNPGNIASCFPNTPTAGGANNILAAFMTDLTFIGAGNIAQCYYWTNFTDSFIVQYSDAPYWQAAVPGYTPGTSTFQVLLCGLDSSITFQYQTVTPVNDILGCNDFVVGIENNSGSIGLGVYLDVMPPTSYAIKFDYPTVVLIAVQDATPFWNQVSGSKGVIVGAGSFPLQSNIKNVGNTNITTTTTISAQIRDLAFVLVYSDADTVLTLNAGASSIRTFNPPTLLTSGSYSFLVSTNNVNDINPTNNQTISEIVVVNACSPTALTYHSANPPDQSVSWNGGLGTDDGMAVFYKPPVYPITINSLEYYIQANTSDGFDARIYANDGPFGAPGTLLSSTSIASAAVVPGGWNIVNLGLPVVIDTAGFYVVWLQTGPSISIGLETTFPISRNTYEILDGAWSEYRSNEDQDAAFKVNITPPGLDNSTSLTGVTITATQAGATYQWLDCDSSYVAIPGATSQNFTPVANGNYAALINFAGCADTTACVLVNSIGIEETLLNNAKVYPNPTESFMNIQLIGNLEMQDISVQVTDIAGKIISLPYQLNMNMIRLNTESLSSGIYTYQIGENEEVYAIGKFVKQ